MQTKYCFIGMVIRNGIFTYPSQTVHVIPFEKNISEFAEELAMRYHAQVPFRKDEEYSWWYFYKGQISVMVETAEEITEQEYKVLKKFQYK